MSTLLPDLDMWQTRLGESIAAALSEYRDHLSEEVVQFAVDCHPWNGLITISLLTTREFEHAPFLAESSEIAAWKHYNFGAKTTSEQSIAELARQTSLMYYDGAAIRASLVDELLQRCARAVALKPVQEALSKYQVSDGFTIAVPHPDTDEEFYSD